jgi:hypothetical protein
MACVTGAAHDAAMVRDIGANRHMTAAFKGLRRDAPDFRDLASEFSEQWPIYRSQDVAKHLGGNYPYRFASREEFTASVEKDNRIKRSPANWAKGGEVTWADMISAIYQVRCNLVHGHKSVYSMSDRELVSSSYKLLLAFVERSGCYHWN